MDIRYCDDCHENLCQIDYNYWWCKRCGSLYNFGIVPMSRKTESVSFMVLKDMLEEYDFNDNPNFRGNLRIHFRKCPDCGRDWDMKKYNSCQCGATIKKESPEKEEFLKNSRGSFNIRRG